MPEVKARQLFFVRYGFTDNSLEDSLFIVVESNLTVLDGRVWLQARNTANAITQGRARLLEIKHAGRLIDIIECD